jgi:hypothetical protein
MDERIFSKERLTATEQEDQQALHEIEARKAESEVSDAEEYSAVLAEIQSESEDELRTPIVLGNEAIVSTSQEVQVLELISKEDVRKPENSITWLRTWEARANQLKRAA